MIKLPLYGPEGKNAGEIEASENIFGRKPNEHVVHSALVWLQATQRRGTHGSKTRAEVRGGGKKPWKQKGTGRARAGSIRSPLWRKGGVVFGPKPRDYGFNLPRKVRKLALKTALSDMAREGKIKVMQELALAELKTKLAGKLLKDLNMSGKTLIILEQKNDGFRRASRNLAGVNPVSAGDLTIFDLLNADWILTETAALARLEEVLA
jgi:large subunit ribosomal protein L4